MAIRAQHFLDEFKTVHYQHSKRESSMPSPLVNCKDEHTLKRKAPRTLGCYDSQRCSGGDANHSGSLLLQSPVCLLRPILPCPAPSYPVSPACLSFFFCRRAPTESTTAPSKACAHRQSSQLDSQEHTPPVAEGRSGNLDANGMSQLRSGST